MFGKFTNVHGYLACFRLLTSLQHVYATNKHTSNDLIAVIPLIRQINKSQLEDSFSTEYSNWAALKKICAKSKQNFTTRHYIIDRFFI